MAIHHVGHQDGDDLPQVHRRREDQGTELLYLRVNEKLSSDRSGTQAPSVDGEVGVRYAETQSPGSGARKHQAGEGDRGGATVDVEHLIVLRRLVLLEEFLLKGGGEPIEGQEAHEQAETIAAGSCICMLGLDVPREQEECYAEGDTARDEPILQLVLLLGDHDPPEHDRHHLEALAEHLHWEGYVLQGLILAPSGGDVREGNGDVLPERRLVGELLVLEPDHEDCVHYRNQAIAQDEED
mmetsp:Transcript_28589/g.62429  ORF Transcript_28589/g.62429 Transcript_28589/m.62429 type:complete len:240 (-) Transcript_28589:208-927(-)